MNKKQKKYLEKRFNSLRGCGNIQVPKISDKIYVPTALYLGHGMDDFMGGIATINGIFESETLPPDHSNYYMISIEENPRTQYNLRYLLEHQEEWKEKYGDEIAHPDPDDRPEFNRWD